MKRSNWVRLLAVILVISLMVGPVSAVTFRSGEGNRQNALVGSLIGRIRDIVRDIIDDWFDQPFPGKPISPKPTTPVDPSEPVDDTDPTGPVDSTDPTNPEDPESTNSGLELVEGYSNTENGQLLRGQTYTLSQVISQQKPQNPISHIGLRKPISILPGNPIGGLRINAVTTTADNTVESTKIEGITGTGSSVDTSEPAYDKSVTNAFDGDTNTFWATVPGGNLNDCYLIADLGGKYTIDKVAYTKRIHNGSYNCTGNLLNCIIEVSTDGTTWKQVAASDTQNGTTEITFDAVEATHVRLKSTSSYHWESANANTVMTCAEFEVYGYQATEPEQPTVDPSDASRDIPVKYLTATAGSAETENGHDEADKVLDGKTDTMWHTDWDGTSDRTLHWIQFELRGVSTIDGMRVLPRQSASNGLITEYEIQISDDGNTFTPVASGTWSYEDRNWKLVSFNAVQTKYVRLVAKNAEGDGRLFASAAEIRLTGEYTGPTDPEAKLIYFPVTMFDYHTNELNIATHIAELNAARENGTEITEWNGMYFSSGTPGAGYNGPTGEYTEATVTTVTYELVTPEINDGGINLESNVDYILVNKRSGFAVALGECQHPSGQNGNQANLHLVNSPDLGIGRELSAAPVSITVALPAGTNDNTFLWKYATDENGRYFMAQNGEYMHYTTTSGGTTTGNGENQNRLTFETVNGDGNAVLIKHANSKYLSDYSGHAGDFYCGYGDKNDPGNIFYIYKRGPATEETQQVPVTGSFNQGYADHNSWNKNTGDKPAGELFYSGLVANSLVEDKIVFNVPEGGIFSYDRSKLNEENNYFDGVKNVYEFVGMPFIIDDTKGFAQYSFDSDANGVYFEDTDNDGNPDPKPGTSTAPNNMVFDGGHPQPLGISAVADKSQNGWWPFDKEIIPENDLHNENINYHFGMRADLPFSMTPNGCVKSTDDNSDHIIFHFSGDDDVWIFIDGKLVADLGGLHNRLDITIDFAENTIVYSEKTTYDADNNTGSFNDTTFATTQKLFNEGTETGLLGMTRVEFATNESHEMQFFYLERGEGTSNCRIEFNLPMLDTLLVTKDATMSWSADQDATDGDKDGTQDLTEREQAAVDNILFGFTLYKIDGAYLDDTGTPIAGVEPKFKPVASTNYFVQDKDGNIIGSGSTDANGRFYLKNGQTAKFMTDMPRTGVTYCLVEDQTPEGFLTPDYKYAGTATNGFSYNGPRLIPGTETVENKNGHVSDAADIGEHELPMVEEGMIQDNSSYIITVKGSIEARDSLEFICVNYVDEQLPKPSAFANEDIIVIDYGLPVQIDPLANDVFRGENVEIVAWGDESLKLNEVLSGSYADEDKTNWSGNTFFTPVTVAQVINDNGNGYKEELIALEDCLYTFDLVDNGSYVISATTKDGTVVYLHYEQNNSTIPNSTNSRYIDVIPSNSLENMFRLAARTTNGEQNLERGLHFHTEKAYPHWNRCSNDPNATCHEYLYRPVRDGENSSSEIPGYVLVTSTDKITDNGQYLIAHKNEDGNMYILRPSTSGNQFDHIAKVTPATEVTTVNDGTEQTYLTLGSPNFDSGIVTFKDKTYEEVLKETVTNDDGTTTPIYEYTRDTFEYKLTKQLTEIEELYYIIKVTAKDDEDNTKTNSRYSLGKVYIVPATIMYYEENFADMITFEGSGWNAESTIVAAGNVSPFQEPGVVGTVDDSTYGSDVAYLSDNGDSNGTYRFGNTNQTTGTNGEKIGGAIRFSYTFTGTGTTIFARTSANTGYMQVKVYAIDEEGNETLQSLTYRDTYWKDQNGNNLDSTGTLYNIPVFSEEYQHYGTYKVVCTVAKAGTPTSNYVYEEDGTPKLDDNGKPIIRGAGNEFYLDGIRVMQPLNGVFDIDKESGKDYQKPVDQMDSLTAKGVGAYKTDGESNLEVATLRQKLITDAQAGGNDWNDKNFAVLTDTNGNIVTASEYISIGPKEEVYLSDDNGKTNAQTVSFSLETWKPEGLKLYMGMKAPFGHAVVNVGDHAIELKNAPDCYYDVTNFGSVTEKKNEDGTTSHIITFTFEAAESIVSLTNIKIVGSYQIHLPEDTDILVEGFVGGNYEGEN